MDCPGLPLMNPGPLMGNREMDQTETVQDASADDQINLPEEANESNTQAWEMAGRDPKDHDDGGHGDVAVAKVASNTYQVSNNLHNDCHLIQ